MKVINKIAFMVHHPMMYVHYSNIWSLLDRDVFVIVLLGKFTERQAEKYVDVCDFLKIINRLGYHVCNLDGLIQQGIKYKYVVSNHNMGAKSISYTSWLIKRFKVNNIKELFVDLLFKILGKETKYKVFKYSPYTFLPEKVGIKHIRFMYGADISDSWSLDSWNERYDLFLCHGPNDAEKLQKRFKGRTMIMGYPRYDGYFSDYLNLKDIYIEFEIDIKKKTILWMPTADLFNENVNSIPHFAKELSVLQNEYNIIVRPHPISFEKEPDCIKLLQKLHYKIDSDSMRDMNILYSVADFVLCDHGGSAFGALYLGKKLILLKTTAKDDSVVIMNSSNLELQRYFPVIDNNEVEKLKKLLRNDGYWNKCLNESKSLSAKYFGDFRGTSSKKTVEILNSLDTILED